MLKLTKKGPSIAFGPPGQGIPPGQGVPPGQGIPPGHKKGGPQGPFGL